MTSIFAALLTPPSLILQYATTLAILAGSHLVAVQIRLKIPWGKPLGPEYQPHPVELFLLTALCLAVAYGLSGLAPRLAVLQRFIAPERQFRVLLLAAALVAASTVVILPDVSQLQLIYFAVSSAVLGVCVVVWPRRLNPHRDGKDFYVFLARLWKNRFLLLLWLGYNVQSRYTQKVLGILWIVLLPLATSAVIALAFTQFLRIQLDVPFVAFLLSAVVPWQIFEQGISKGMHAIQMNMSLINRVAFPRETLVLLVLGEVLVDFVFTFIAMLIINALSGIWPNAYFAYLLLLLFILVCFTLGLMLFVSCLSVMVRDVPQLVSVILRLLFYLTPLLYPIESIPPRFQVLVLLNPLASVLQACRDVIVYHRPPDLVTVYYPLVVSLALLYMGYVFFKANEERLADFS